MKEKTALKLLGEIMQWTNSQSIREFAWLRLMARLKYDGYRDFQAGMRFVESLATWLQQFQQRDREVAYTFVRQQLIYIGPSELNSILEQFYPRFVQEQLLHTVAQRRNKKPYELMNDSSAQTEIDILRRKTLYMALSDGARIDTVRHVNVGLISNEQVVASTQADSEKWRDMLDTLRGPRAKNGLDDPTCKFSSVYLIDDFMGTGSSLLRQKPSKEWTGKLWRFKKSLENVFNSIKECPFGDGWSLHVHHYVGSHRAAANIEGLWRKAKDVFPHADWPWAARVDFTFGMILPEVTPITRSESPIHPMVLLTDAYYDSILQTASTDVGGVAHLGLGYAGCGLPLVLEHNTPNNSIALLWAETDGGIRKDGIAGHSMRPLFRRRQRHTT